MVEYVVTSCNRRAALLSAGVRTQHTSVALPMSNAATRSMISSLSCVCSTAADLPLQSKR
jgi:hypothetical protein